MLQNSVPSEAPPLHPLSFHFSLIPEAIQLRKHSLLSNHGTFSHFLGGASHMDRDLITSLSNGFICSSISFQCYDYNSKRKITLAFPVFHEFLWYCFGSALVQVELLGSKHCYTFCWKLNSLSFSNVHMRCWNKWKPN